MQFVISERTRDQNFSSVRPGAWLLSVRVLILTQLRRSPKQRWSYGFARPTVSPLVGWPTALVNDRSLIAQLELQPHPEGGWYREIHRSTQAISRSDGEARSALTTILFLLHAGEISSWHRVSAADETWHFAGGEVRRQCLGPVENGLSPVAVLEADWWQAARSTGTWNLVSCCVGPGFDFADYSLLRDLPEHQRPSGAMPEFH